jgi:hypothetical protein
MGYQLKDVCYPDLASAQDAYFLGFQPLIMASSSVYDASTVIFYYIPNKVNGSWYMGRYNYTNGSVTNSFIPKPVLGTCTTSSDPTANFQAGLELGSAVAAVCVLAFLWRYLRVRF